MILTDAQKKERIEWMREQALWIQREPEAKRTFVEREWLTWAERRVYTLVKEDTP